MLIIKLPEGDSIFIDYSCSFNRAPNDHKHVKCHVKVNLNPNKKKEICEYIVYYRNTSSLLVAKRLIGTRITLIGETTNTICGTIETVQEDLSTAYTVICPPSTELTLQVRLDDETSLYGDLNRTVMQIAEITAFGTESGSETGM